MAQWSGKTSGRDKHSEHELLEHRSNEPYQALAWALVESAMSDIADFRINSRRRQYILGTRHAARRANDRKKKESQLHGAELADHLAKVTDRAELTLRCRCLAAEQWIKGSPSLYPFRIAAMALGWDEDLLRARLLDPETVNNVSRGTHLVRARTEAA